MQPISQRLTCPSPVNQVSWVQIILSRVILSFYQQLPHPAFLSSYLPFCFFFFLADLHRCSFTRKSFHPSASSSSSALNKSSVCWHEIPFQTMTHLPSTLLMWLHTNGCFQCDATWLWLPTGSRGVRPTARRVTPTTSCCTCTNGCARLYEHGLMATTQKPGEYSSNQIDEVNQNSLCCPQS